MNPALEETGHEGISGPENVENFNLSARIKRAIGELLGNWPVQHRAANCSQLHHQSGIGQPTYLAQRSHEITGAPSDIEFFFSTNNEIEAWQEALEMTAYIVTGDKPGFAVRLSS
ncbi:hypothetical protein D3C72_1917110 [compost metagenome]